MKSIFHFKSAQSFLAHELERRRTANKSYSQSAFARDIGMSASRLSEVLKDNSPLSTRSAHTIASRLKLNELEREFLFLMLAYNFGKTKDVRTKAWNEMRKRRTLGDYKLERNNFSILNRWYYIPIMEYVTADNHPTYLSIAEKIGVSETLVATVVGELEAVGYIYRSGPGWKKSDELSKFENPAGSDVIRNYHKEYLSHAQKYIDQQPLARRKYMTSVLRIRESDLEQARREIEIFNQNFIKKYSRNQESKLVYCLANQFYEIMER